MDMRKSSRVLNVMHVTLKLVLHDVCDARALDAMSQQVPALSGQLFIFWFFKYIN